MKVRPDQKVVLVRDWPTPGVSPYVPYDDALQFREHTHNLSMLFLLVSQAVHATD